MTPHTKKPAAAGPSQGKDTSFLDWALRYAELGWRVIPCKPRGKEPLIPDWPNRASSDPDQIRRWWGRWPDANIGILTGPVAVLDFDPRNGGDWTDYDLPPTVVCHTGGGGRHYYFTAPTGVRGSKIGPGVDLKGDGGYVIAPPSVHPGGGEYVWEVGASPWEAPMAPLPGWVLGGEATNPTLWREHKEGRIPEGQRNNVLFSYACYLRRRGAGEGEILEALLGWNERCAPPLGHKELEGIARSACRYDPGRPAHNGAAGGGKGRPRKRDQAFDALMQARWVRHRGRVYIADAGVLYGIEEAYIYLAGQGIHVAASTGAELARAVVASKERMGQVEALDGAVVLLDPAPRFGKADGVEGIFFRHQGKVWCYTPAGGLIEVKEGVYYRLSATLPARPQGGLQDLLVYIKLAFTNLASPEDPRIALCAIAPVLLGLGNAGLLLEGPGGSGKSTAGKALYRLAYLEDPATPIGDSKRDLLATLIDRRIVFHDDLEAMDAVQEDLIRIGITGGLATARELYTTQSIELELSGSAIVCGVSVGFRNPTTVERFIRLGFAPAARAPERELEALFRERAPAALGGLLELYAKASQMPPPPDTDQGEMRLRNWYSWALRFARVLGVEAKFRTWLFDMAGQLAEKVGPWGELYHMLKGELGEGKYSLSDLAKLILERRGETAGEGQIRGLVRKATANAGQELITIAGKCGYDLHLSKERDPKSRKLKWFVEIRKSTYTRLDQDEAHRWAQEVMAAAAGVSPPQPPTVVLPPQPATGALPPRLSTEPAPLQGGGDVGLDGWTPLRQMEAIAQAQWEAHTRPLMQVLREVREGIDPQSPHGRIWARAVDAFRDALRLVQKTATTLAILRALPDIPEVVRLREEEEALHAESTRLLQEFLDLFSEKKEALGEIYLLSRVEVAPGGLWYGTRDILDKLRAAGFADLATEWGDMIQPYNGYNARVGIFQLARGVWGRRRDNPEGFESVWPRMTECLQMALGDNWMELLNCQANYER